LSNQQNFVITLRRTPWLSSRMSKRLGFVRLFVVIAFFGIVEAQGVGAAQLTLQEAPSQASRQAASENSLSVRRFKAIGRGLVKRGSDEVKLALLNQAQKQIAQQQSSIEQNLDNAPVSQMGASSSPTPVVPSGTATNIGTQTRQPQQQLSSFPNQANLNNLAQTRASAAAMNPAVAHNPALASNEINSAVAQNTMNLAANNNGMNPGVPALNPAFNNGMNPGVSALNPTFNNGVNRGGAGFDVGRTGKLGGNLQGAQHSRAQQALLNEGSTAAQIAEIATTQKALQDKISKLSTNFELHLAELERKKGSNDLRHSPSHLIDEAIHNAKKVASSLRRTKSHKRHHRKRGPPKITPVVYVGDHDIPAKDTREVKILGQAKSNRKIYDAVYTDDGLVYNPYVILQVKKSVKRHVRALKNIQQRLAGLLSTSN